MKVGALREGFLATTQPRSYPYSSTELGVLKTENSCEFVDLLYIVVYILDEIKFSFTEFSFTELKLVNKFGNLNSIGTRSQQPLQRRSIPST